MPESLFPDPPLTFASNRADALAQLQAFIPAAGRYGRDRNHVVPGHTNVSRLSPAIRHRLVLEYECATAPLSRYAPSTVEKFTQEVYWRRYWKSWLSLRPQVWSTYLEELRQLREDEKNARLLERVGRCEQGKGPIAIMNHFARELVDTGYLHNHARMWFAAWWVHVEGLPWQLGADFFYRHLLDGDPASNTLSWRWVAGLQTPGKTYLPRRSNLEKYLPADLLEAHAEGLEQLEAPQALMPDSCPRPEITRRTLPESPKLSGGRLGILVHEEDLLIEESPLADLGATSMLVIADRQSWSDFDFPESKRRWLQQALADAAGRVERKLGITPEAASATIFDESVKDWARRHELDQVVTMRPEIGPLHDRLKALETVLRQMGVSLVLVDRIEDLELRSLATGGFFGFWKKVQKKLKLERAATH